VPINWRQFVCQDVQDCQNIIDASIAFFFYLFPIIE